MAEVGARPEEAVAALPGEPDSPQALYDRYEEMAIVMLDSEYLDWPGDAMEDYLRHYLLNVADQLGGRSGTSQPPSK